MFAADADERILVVAPDVKVLLRATLLALVGAQRGRVHHGFALGIDIV